MHRRIASIFVAVVAVAADDSIAQGMAANAARDLAATCASCHRPGEASPSGIANLAGMKPEVLVASMQAFRSGARPGTVMPQLAKGYTDREIESIAAWYAVQQAPK